ncbi:hypothetical protein [Flavobacterium sp.]|jgi:hypothetical protein|uniref:hypothetical protein n=1 Tax=Flavobacterium sp. TaxID=239 RepID=UPI0037BE421A
MNLESSYLGLSTTVSSQTVLTGNRITLPAWVDEDKFTAIYKQEITQPTLTPEKAIYVALTSSKRASAHRLSPLN